MNHFIFLIQFIWNKYFSIFSSYKIIMLSLFTLINILNFMCTHSYLFFCIHSQHLQFMSFILWTTIFQISSLLVCLQTFLNQQKIHCLVWHVLNFFVDSLFSTMCVFVDCYFSQLSAKHISQLLSFQTVFLITFCL